jgi:hypothetical protein
VSPSAPSVFSLSRTGRRRRALAASRRQRTSAGICFERARPTTSVAAALQWSSSWVVLRSGGQTMRASATQSPAGRTGRGKRRPQSGSPLTGRTNCSACRRSRGICGRARKIILWMARLC